MSEAKRLFYERAYGDLFEYAIRLEAEAARVEKERACDKAFYECAVKERDLAWLKSEKWCVCAERLAESLKPFNKWPGVEVALDAFERMKSTP